MADMGRHPALLNGHQGGDGRRAPAGTPVMPLPALRAFPLGPVPWPPGPAVQAPPPDTVPDTVPDTPAAPRLSGDRLRRAFMWLLASGVAAIAAVVSYSHIYDLGRAHGGTGVSARLLPLSVDMLILVGELMLLHEADGRGKRFLLGWVLVWSGILATLGANVTYGAQFGVLGALIWGWPAYSFILAAGGMVAVVKRGAARDVPAVTGLAVQPDTAPDTGGTGQDIPADTAPDITPDKPADMKAAAPQVMRRGKAVTGQDKAADILRRNPGLPNAEVARRARVSAKTVQRARDTIKKETADA